MPLAGKVTDEMKRQMAEDRKNGMSRGKIAAKFHLADATVHYHLVRMGLHTPKARSTQPPKNVPLLRAPAGIFFCKFKGCKRSDFKSQFALDIHRARAHGIRKNGKQPQPKKLDLVASTIRPHREENHHGNGTTNQSEDDRYAFVALCVKVDGELTEAAAHSKKTKAELAEELVTYLSGNYAGELSH